MAYFNFKNGETPLNDTNLNLMQIGLMELVFPVGSTYITTTNVNPNTILKFGTWERIKGKVLVGLDENDETFNTIGKVGGEKEHLLSIEEIPNHAHTNDKNAGNGQETSWGYSRVEANNMGTATTGYTGGGLAHNNLQPYEVIGYMWKRTA